MEIDMIILENDFLKLYSEMNELWEDIDSNSTEIFGDDYAFETIAKRAINDSTKVTFTSEELKYWCEVRKRIMNKYVRPGEAVCKNWCTKFMAFYKAYKAECAILNWLKNNGHEEYGISSPKFGDGSKHDKLLVDSGEPVADISVTINNENRKIECKTVDVTAAIHEADLVARHTAINVNSKQKTQEIRFCLVGQPGKGDNQGCVVDSNNKVIFNKDQVMLLKSRRVLSVIDPNKRTLRDRFKKVFLASFGKTLSIEFDTEVLTALEQIEQKLESSTPAIKNKIELIFDNYADKIDDTTQNLLDKHYYSTNKNPPAVELPSISFEQATQNLVKVAKDLTDSEQK
jgi:hypothetical protein